MSQLQQPLVGQTAWVTGASRGIGRAIATRLAREGATVVVGSRSLPELEDLVEILRTGGATAHALPLDVASWDSVTGFAKRAVEIAGPPDILINNAGWGLFRDFLAMDASDFDRQVDINLKGPWYTARVAAPHMKRKGAGAIINIGSIAGRVPFKRGTAYCAAKAGVHAFSEALMLELREFGIRVATVAPGSVQTRFHREALPAAHARDDSWMLEPEMIADACMHILQAPASALISFLEVRPLNPSAK